METFFLAETMKYLHLLFANPEAINADDCVFSAEDHPFWKEVMLNNGYFADLSETNKNNYTNNIKKA